MVLSESLFNIKIGMKKKYYLFVVALAAALSSCGGGSGKPDFSDNEFATRTVGTSSADLQTTYPATIKGVQDVEIRPKISGFLTQVCVHEGQAVKASQLLFVIDNVTYQAAARQAQAAVHSAKSQLSTAKLTYVNSQKLFAKNIIGQFELDNARNTYVSAQAALEQAQAAYVSAKQNLDFCYITAPASGVIGSLPFKKGALVSASSVEPLTTVSNISSMEVYFSMTEKDVLAMTKNAGGMGAAIADYPAVKLQLADGTMYNHPGKVTKMSGVIDPATGSVSMIASFPNPEHLLKSGGAGQIVVPDVAGSSHLIIIPQEATSQVQDKIFVYLVGKNDKVKYTEITVNPQNDGKNYIVTGGLHVGDRIVTKGLAKLQDGMTIRPITEERYEQKIREAEKLAEKQATAKGFVDAMSGKK